MKIVAGNLSFRISGSFQLRGQRHPVWNSPLDALENGIAMITIRN